MANCKGKGKRTELNNGLQIGSIKLKNNLLLAPLAGVTDVGFRAIAREFGASLSYTEMVSAKGLKYQNANTECLLATSSLESPCAVQLFGSEPDIISEAVTNPLLDKFDIIDINMGCPMVKIVKNGEGSALMKNPSLASEVIKSAVQSTSKPVTVKFRLGYEEIVAPKFAEMCQKAGASCITIHGRTRSQMYSGRANYAPIADSVRAVSIPVVVNGDIVCRETYLQAMEETGASGAMVGRASMGKPYVFAKILGEEYTPSTRDIVDIILRHIAELERFFSDRFIALNMRKHVSWYLRGVRGSKDVKERVMHAQTTSEVVNAVLTLVG